MRTIRSLTACSATLALLITASPVEAAFIHANDGTSFTPRGFRRSISRNRDALQRECGGIEDDTEKRRCFLNQSRSRRVEPLNKSFYQREEDLQRMGQRCGHLTNVGHWRACAKGERTGLHSKDNRRIFNKRTSRRQAKENIEECRQKETSEEKLRCLQSHGTTRTSKVKLNRRNRLVENKPVEFISPHGLRRNLSRTRDLIREECGTILDGQEKWQCIKRIKGMYQGY